MATDTDGKELEGQLDAVAEQLGVPPMTIQTTRVRFDRLEAEPNVDEEALAGVAPATLALSIWKDGLPITDAEILDAWAAEAGKSLDAMPDPETFEEHVASVGSALDVDEVPRPPTERVWEYGESLDLDEDLVAAATRLLRAVFQEVPRVVANGSDPASTAAAALSLAADLNDVEGVTLRELGDVTGTSEVSVRNRYRDLREAYGGSADADVAQATATDGTGDAGVASQGGADVATDSDDAAGVGDESDAVDHGEPGAGVDGSSAEETGDEQFAVSSDASEMARTPLTVEAVEDEIDDLTETLSIDPSVRLFARGMASDAVDDVEGLGAGELAGAAVVAGARREDAALDATDVAASRHFDVRAISRGLDSLDGAIDVDIPRRVPSELVEELATTLSLPEPARRESERVLSGFDDNVEYTARELAAGAVAFAVTVGDEGVDLRAVADAAGADRTYVEEVMSDVLVGQCLGLVGGDIAYEECAWTGDLLDSDLASVIAGSEAGPAVSVAMIYVAGREGRSVDAETVDVLLAEE